MNKWFTKVLVIMMMVVVLLLNTTPIYASKQANVVVTGTGIFYNITVAPTTYNFGIQDPWAIIDSGAAAFNVASTSSVTIHVSINAATWTSAGVAWAYGTQAYNAGMLSCSTDGSYSTNLTLAGTSYNLTDNLAAAANDDFELRLYFPSDFADGQQNSSNITLDCSRA